MIPHDQKIAVCRIILCAVLDKVSQSIGTDHALSAEILLKSLKTAAGDAVTLVCGIGDNGVVPLFGSSGLYDDIDLVIVQTGMEHFVQIRGSHSVIAFQIGAAKVNHDGHFVLAVSEHFCIALTGTVRDRCGDFSGGCCCGDRFRRGAVSRIIGIREEDVVHSIERSTGI